MGRRMPTLSDVAHCAGVSYATADRAMNGRGGVSEKSMRRVLNAVEELGYVRNVAAANLSQRRTYRFTIVIPEGTNTFFAHVRAILAEARSRLLADRVELQVVPVAAFDPSALTRCLRRLAGQDIDGVALVGNNDPHVYDALADLRARGIAVITMISDVPGARRDAYAGIDNIIAGRTAARMIVLAHGGKAGRVLPIVGALSARDHADRLAGLGETLAASSLTLAPEVEGRDQHGIVEEKLRAALAEDPEISAVYNAGAGNAGLIRVIAATPAQNARPIVVLHELVPHTRRALEAGLIDIVIDQRPDVAVAQTLDCLRDIADRRPVSALTPIVPAIYVKENLPPDDRMAATGVPQP